MSADRSLYITLQYLRHERGQNKYHWGLYATGDKAPKGTLFHATDADRPPLDLYYDSRTVSNPMKSKTMVVCLKIADASSQSDIDRCVKRVRLMDPRSLPRGEPRWTCRVWVKEALEALDQSRIIRLRSDVDTIEVMCLRTADAYLPRRSAGSQPGVYNDLSWMSGSSGSSRPVPMEIDQPSYYGGQQPYYGSKPMIIDAAPSGYYGSSSMNVDPRSTYGSRMDVDPRSTYGSRMEVDPRSNVSYRTIEPPRGHSSQPKKSSKSSKWF